MTSEDWAGSGPLGGFLETLALVAELSGAVASAVDLDTARHSGREGAQRAGGGDEGALAGVRHRGVLLGSPDEAIGDIIQAADETRKGAHDERVVRRLGPVAIAVRRARASASDFERIVGWLERQLPQVARSVRERAASEALGEGILLVDGQSRVALCTDRAAAILGVTSEQVEGRDLGLVLPQAPRGLEPNEVARGALSGEHLHTSFIARHMAPSPDGVERPGLVIKLRDDRRFEGQRKRYLRFLSALRHDVRSPLTALKGLVSVLMDEPEMPAIERERLLALLKQEAERTVTWVEDYLLILRLRFESRPNQLLPMPAQSLVESMLRRFAGHAAERKIALAFAPPPPTASREVYFDPGLIEAFGNNLLGHVLRLGDVGAEVEVALVDKGGGGPPALTIRGAGPGLFASHPAEPFMTLARSTAAGKRTPGVGLGLFLVKKVADVHGWKIRCEVASGPGSAPELRPELRIEVDWGDNRAGVLPWEGA